jgi:hypothetical protein
MPFIMEPEAAAREVFEHMNSDRFKKSFPTLFSLLVPRQSVPGLISFTTGFSGARAEAHCLCPGLG